MEPILFITLPESPFEFYHVHTINSKQLCLEPQRENWSGVRTDPDNILSLSTSQSKYSGSWKPKDCDLVVHVLGIGEDYAKGVLKITLHSSRVAIYVSAGSGRTPQNWMRVNDRPLMSRTLHYGKLH